MSNLMCEVNSLIVWKSSIAMVSTPNNDAQGYTVGAFCSEDSLFDAAILKGRMIRYLEQIF